MKRLLALAGVAALALIAGCSANARHIQATSSIDQCRSGQVQFDSFSGQGITGSRQGFTVSEGGTYFVMAAPQVGSIKGKGGPGVANFWITINGKPAPASNVSLALKDAGAGDVIVSQGAYDLSTGDRVSVQWSTTGPCMEAIKPANEPLVPSIIYTMFKL